MTKKDLNLIGLVSISICYPFILSTKVYFALDYRSNLEKLTHKTLITLECNINYSNKRWSK